MLNVVVSGLVTGWAIAIPIGAVAAMLVTLTARTSIRVGAAGALGIAFVDGVYATLAVTGGAAIGALVAPIADGLRIGSAVILLAIATWMVVSALRRGRSAYAPVRNWRPWQAFLGFVAITAANPATIVYFVAVVLGNPQLTDGWWQGVVFVLCAFAASASWQLTLAGGGAVLARSLTGPRGQLVTAFVSAAVIAGLALWTLAG